MDNKELLVKVIKGVLDEDNITQSVVYDIPMKRCINGELVEGNVGDKYFYKLYNGFVHVSQSDAIFPYPNDGWCEIYNTRPVRITFLRNFITDIKKSIEDEKVKNYFSNNGRGGGLVFIRKCGPNPKQDLLWAIRRLEDKKQVTYKKDGVLHCCIKTEYRTVHVSSENDFRGIEIDFYDWIIDSAESVDADSFYDK